MNESLSLLREEDDDLLFAILQSEHPDMIPDKKEALGELLDRLVSRRITMMMLEGRITWGENADMD